MKKAKKFKTVKKAGVIVWSVISLFLVALLVTLTVLENTFLSSILPTVLGGPMPIKGDNTLDIYKSDYKSKAESTEAGNELNVRIAEEGFTLLLNENNALPIDTTKSKPKVSVFGKNSVDLVLTGSGSGGGANTESAKTIFDGLKKGGFEVNETLRKFYESNSKSGKGRSESPELSEASSKAPTLMIGETPISRYTSDIKKSFRNYNDAAIVVISRIGGESFDLPRTQDMKNGGIQGNHYLQLDKNEYDMLDMVTMYFDKVIVVLNTLTSFQCDFIAEYNNSDNKRIDAVLWIGGPGCSGADAIGDILSGKVNPSGKTVDIYSKDFTKDPTWQNFGDGSQVTTDGSDNTAYLQNNSKLAGYNIVTYEESVYLGYRYYETRAYEESIKGTDLSWYENNVLFPFGYGLSYTTFEQEITEISGNLDAEDSVVTIKVQVKNTGSREGKDVVELYVNKPYTYGGIEKPYVELVDFAKTPVIAAGGTEEVTFKISPYDLASYDYNDANGNGFFGYELEEGDYNFHISADSHIAEHSYDMKTISIEEGKGLTFRKDNVTDADVENRFTTGDYYDSSYKLSTVSVDGEERKGMSRVDFEKTFPTPLTKEERTVSFEPLNGKTELDALRNMEHNNTEIEKIAKMYKMGEDGTLMLRDLVDESGVADFKDDRWEQLLDRLTFKEMLSLVNNGAYQTAAIESIGKNITNDSDGPLGYVCFLNNYYKDNTTFSCANVVASTWNRDLAYQMGKIVGENGLWGAIKGNGLPYSGWYAPAVNLHRSPFSGRNYEYYSEDPILSGKMAVNVINAAKTKGVYTNLKHFALNDQETNRAGVSTFCTEQAMRELYLKPFEIAVKGDDDPSVVESAVKDGITEYKGSYGVMSSFNRIGNKWTGGDYRLLTEVLRNEWGFKGLVICDYKTQNAFMNSRQMLYAGNDLILASLPDLMWQDADAGNEQDVTILRQATKNILYTIANSNSVQIEVVGYRMEWWRALTISLDVIIPVGLAVWGFFAIRKMLKKSKQEDEQNQQTDN